MAAKLVAEEGLLKGLTLTMDQGDQWIIGRDPDFCQLLVEDPLASRKHLVCRSTPTGIIAENLSETNPAQVNNEDLKEPRLLRNGDSVKIGSGVFRFYSEAAAQLMAEPKEQLNTDNAHAEEPAVEEEEAEAPSEASPEAATQQPRGAEEEHKEEPHIDAGPPLPTDGETDVEAKEEPAEAAETAEAAVEEPSPEDDAEAEAPAQEEKPLEALPGDAEAETPEAETPETETPAAETPPTETPETATAETLAADTLASETPAQEEAKVEEAPAQEEEKEDSVFEDAGHDISGDIAEINFDLTETGRWLLKVIAGPNNGAEFSMQSGSTYLLGTDPNSCDVVFHDTSVSRQHARITITPEDKLFIEDLKSRNGTLVDGEPVKVNETLETNKLVSMGTTSFIVFDREGEMQTIISPLMPSIVKVLQQKEEAQKAEAAAAAAATAAAAAAAAPPVGVGTTPQPVETTAKEKTRALGAFILIALVTGLLVIVGIGTTALFHSENVVMKEQVDTTQALGDALKPFPDVKWSFNKATGNLLLVGHVLTPSDKNQLLYNLQGDSFIRNLDDSGIVIDEYVWQEINQVLLKNPNWKGITIQSPKPGNFIITGYLQTRKQADQLSNYIATNFSYPDLLENRIVVEEDVVNSVTAALQQHGIPDVTVQMSEGEVVLTGGVPPAKAKDFDYLLSEFKAIPGVRNVINHANSLAPELSMINISDKYEVTGFSHQGNNVNVVINGRILTKGDIIDGMTITSIKPNAVFLDKDGTKYRIDYNK